MLMLKEFIQLPARDHGVTGCTAQPPFVCACVHHLTKAGLDLLTWLPCKLCLDRQLRVASCFSRAMAAYISPGQSLLRLRYLRYLLMYMPRAWQASALYLLYVCYT